MKTLDNCVLQLAEDVYAGRCSYQKTVSRIAAIEAQYGSIDRDIAYPNSLELSPQDYMDELVGRVRLGLYSKSIILELAKAAEIVYEAKINGSMNKKRMIICIAIAAAIVVLAVAMAISVGE